MQIIAEHDPDSPVSASSYGRCGMNPAKNTTFSPSFPKKRGECCISCNNLGPVGCKSRKIAGNFALYTRLVGKYRSFPRFDAKNTTFAGTSAELSLLPSPSWTRQGETPSLRPGQTGNFPSDYFGQRENPNLILSIPIKKVTLRFKFL